MHGMPERGSASNSLLIGGDKDNDGEELFPEQIFPDDFSEHFAELILELRASWFEADAKAWFTAIFTVLSDNRPVLLSWLRWNFADEGRLILKSWIGDMELDDVEEWGELTTDEVDKNEGDAMSKGDPGPSLSTNWEDSVSLIFKFRFKFDTEGSKGLTIKFALSNRGLTETRLSLIDDDDVRGTNGTSALVFGEKDDKGDELDDNGDSVSGPPLSIESFSSCIQSRSSSKIPSSIESKVNGIILIVILWPM